jgi:hypothetical protein
MSGEPQAGMDQRALERALQDDEFRKKLEADARAKGVPLATMKPDAPLVEPAFFGPPPRTRGEERREFAARLAQALLTSAGASVTDAGAMRMMNLAVNLADKLQQELDKPHR